MKKRINQEDVEEFNKIRLTFDFLTIIGILATALATQYNTGLAIILATLTGISAITSSDFLMKRDVFRAKLELEKTIKKQEK